MANEYGTDLGCSDDIGVNADDVGERLVLIQALYRRLITPRESLCDDENYGLEVAKYIDKEMSRREVAMLASLIDAEFKKDPRVYTSTTVGEYVKVTKSAGKYNAKTTIYPVTGRPFSLVLSASEVTLELLEAA